MNSPPSNTKHFIWYMVVPYLSINKSKRSLISKKKLQDKDTENFLDSTAVQKRNIVKIFFHVDVITSNDMFDVIQGLGAEGIQVCVTLLKNIFNRNMLVYEGFLQEFI